MRRNSDDALRHGDSSGFQRGNSCTRPFRARRTDSPSERLQDGQAAFKPVSGLSHFGSVWHAHIRRPVIWVEWRHSSASHAKGARRDHDLPLEPGTDRHYAAIRTTLERKVSLIGANDLLIAAQAGAIVTICVTDNLAEFKRVPALKVENWLV